MCIRDRSSARNSGCKTEHESTIQNPKFLFCYTLVIIHLFSYDITFTLLRDSATGGVAARDPSGSPARMLQTAQTPNGYS
eukprot:664911-Pyramimonas_sp.AAC.1